MKMIGAIIGDIVGSVYEFNNIKTKDFELISPNSTFTDDTVLTIAIMDCLNNNDVDNVVHYLQKWARKYYNAGYGTMFSNWMYDNNPKPYNSCGNGSAMRISPVGWVANSIDEVKELSYKLTSCTHNHIEGIKGAEVTATLIYMARNNYSKDKLKEYALSMYPEINDLDYDILVKEYFHGAEICQVTVPQVIYCFLISSSFEDCLRTTISIGGDCDTTAAISMAIAEAYYNKIDKELENKVMAILPEDIKEVIMIANRKIKGK